MSNIFEQATRKQLRFQTQVGDLSVEQLWKLPLSAPSNKPSLDAIAIDLDEKIKSQKTTSFVKSNAVQTAAQAENKLKFDVVIHVIEVLSSEKDKAAQRQAASAKAATIREELNRRSHEKLLGSEDAALQAELAELEKVISG